MDRSIEPVRQRAQVLELYRVMLEEVREENKHLPAQCCCKGKKNAKKF
jgi:hypothetical protein